MKSPVLILLISLLTPVSGSPGQTSSPRRLAQSIRFDHVTVSDGLPDNNIMAIAQDHLGFLWFGTWNGLAKYDGYEFTTYLPIPDDARSLRSRVITCLLEDRQKRLWIGTSKGLNRYRFETEDFSQVKKSDDGAMGLKNEYVNALYEDRNGRIWIGGPSGLDRYDPDTRTCTHYTYGLSEGDSRGFNGVRAVCEGKDGQIIVGTLAGLCKLDPTGNGYYPFLEEVGSQLHLSHKTVSSLYRDDDDILWIGTYNGLIRHDFKQGNSRLFLSDSQSSRSIVGNVVTAIYEDRNHTLWAATALYGINRYDPLKQEFISSVYDPNDPRSMSGNWVLSICEDRSHILWFGCWGDGVNKFNPYKNKFIHIKRIYNTSNSLSNNRVFCIREDTRGSVWIGTDGGGLNRFEPLSGAFTAFRNNPRDPSSLGSDVISCVYEDKSNTIWIGSRNGLSKLVPTSGRGGVPSFRHYRHDPRDSTSLRADYVESILEDAKGNLWIGTLGGGLNRLPKSELKKAKPRFYHFVYDPQDSTSFDYLRVVSIIEDRSGTIWIATDGRGLKRYNPSTNNFTTFSDPHDGSDEVSCIFEDSSDRMWIGTYSGGLHLFDRATGLREVFTETDGLPSNAIKGILEDGEHNLWISTERGLSKFRYATRTFRNYGVSDGLQSDRFFTNAACRGRHGLLYFGGSNGFNIVDPGNIVDNPYPPAVVFTGLTIQNRRLSIGGDSPLRQSVNVATSIELSYRENDITIGFAALHFGSPEENLFSYRLDNYEDEWRFAHGIRQARYTNLDPGEYTFRVQASNDDGIWNRQGASLHIVITPPFWKTWAFRISLGILLLGTLRVLYKRRISRLESKKEELELQIKERTLAAQALEGALQEVERLKDRLQSENVYLQDEIRNIHNFENIITQSETFKNVLGSIEKAATTDATLLILGESGTGKELVARAVHNISNRCARPLVKVDCTTLPTSLIESELFGHEKGAFTGAVAQRLGRIEMANGGTLFLDEIGDLPLELQAKLLRVLQEREYERLGSTKTIKVDVRVIAATNRDLEKETKRGVFREDLYYRLNVFPIRIPPLRERKEDIPLLVNHFTRKYSARVGKNIEVITQQLIDTLTAYDWPGNVRELENIIERAVIISPSKRLVLGDWFSMNRVKTNGARITTLEESERNHILEILEMTGWRVSGEKGAAKLLGLKPTTLEFRMKKLGIVRKP